MGDKSEGSSGESFPNILPVLTNHWKGINQSTQGTPMPGMLLGRGEEPRPSQPTSSLLG